MKLLLSLILPALISLSSCKPKTAFADTPQAQKEELLLTDREFSMLCAKEGYSKSHLQYIDSNGIMLYPNAMPLIGADAIDEILRTSDEGFILQWEPKEAVVSASNDLGFTYGIYRIDPVVGGESQYGNYVTIWRKQPNGKWKFLLHSGNQGIEMPN